MRRFVLLEYVLVFLTPLLVLLLFSNTTSPLHSYPPQGDSGFFMLIGSSWLQGATPYLDLWDQKGPFIFLANLLGFAITGNRYGVFLLQYGVLLSLCWFMYMLFKPLSRKRAWSYMVAFLFLYSFMLAGGNTVEEYVLPLLMFSFVYLYRCIDRYIGGGPFGHHPAMAFLYGVMLALCVFSRATNFIGLGVSVLFICCLLVRVKAWRQLFLNGISFIAGLLICSIPVLFYFWKKDALGEMWYAAVTANMEYLSNSQNSYFAFTDIIEYLRGPFHAARNFVCCIVPMLVGIWVLFFNSRRRQMGLFLFIPSLVTLLLFLRSNGYAHYALICVPFFCVSLLELEHECFEVKRGKLMKKIVMAYFFLISVYCSCYDVYYCKLSLQYNYDEEFADLLHSLPSDYKSSFIAYNCSPAVYLYEGIRPAIRFFALQDFQMKNIPSLRPLMHKEFDKGVKFMLVRTVDDAFVKSLLRERYTLFKEDRIHKLKVYRLNE